MHITAQGTNKADTHTYDSFLDGKVKAWQPKSGFRSGVDAVLLAASVPAKPNQSTLELGCGVGIASLCLSARVNNLTLYGVEIQSEYAKVCVQNATENACNFTPVTADVQTLPETLSKRQFDHIFANPPYYQRSQGPSAHDSGRDIALAGETPLRTWVEIAAKRLAPKGSITMIQHISRMPDLLSAFHAQTGTRLGSIAIKPITPRDGRAPNLFLIQARHGGKAPFRMSMPLALHKGHAHQGDQESYCEDVQCILRHGSALTW